MAPEHVLDRISAFLDDELDAISSRVVQQHLKSCAECAAALARQRALSESLRDRLEYHRTPDLLRARVMRDLGATAKRDTARWWTIAPQWGTLSAAAAVLMVVGGIWLGTSLPLQLADDATTREAVSGHIRSLMASHLMDVASTDQHTVKPWFNGKLDFSPPVTDFAAADFPLIGGRLDYLQGHTVAALVYAHRKHVINVFVWPVERARESVAPAATQQGFHVIHGTHAGMAYWVVSDLNAQELAGFARMFVAQSAPPLQGSIAPQR